MKRLLACDGNTERSCIPACNIVTVFKAFRHIPIAAINQALREITCILRPGAHAYFSEPMFSGKFNKPEHIFRKSRWSAHKPLQRIDQPIRSDLLRKPLARRSTAFAFREGSLADSAIPSIASLWQSAWQLHRQQELELPSPRRRYHEQTVRNPVSATALPVAPAFAQQPIVIKLSHVTTANTPIGKSTDHFKKLAEEPALGRVKVIIYPFSLRKCSVRSSARSLRTRR